MNEPFADRLAEGIAGKATRRGVISTGLRSLVGLGMGAAMLFGSRRYAFAATQCDDPVRVNTCGVNPATQCGTYPTADGCGPTGACEVQFCSTSTSNCIGGATVWCPNGCYWDCCCDGKVHRCRDCKRPTNGTKCVCHHEFVNSSC